MLDLSSLTFLGSWVFCYLLISAFCLFRFRSVKAGYPLLLGALIAFSVNIFCLSLEFEMPEGEVGAGFIPLVLCLIIIVLSVWELLQTWRKREEFCSGDREAITVRQEVLTVPFATLLYLLSINQLGYFTSTACYFLIAAFVLGCRSVSKSVSIAVAWLVFVYLVFKLVLQVPLPQGVLL